MDIGVGLPSAVPGFSGGELIEWARRAERLGFSTLGVLDRLVYPNGEPLTCLAAAAAATHRIRLASTVLVAPYRPSAALLAKQIATIDVVSGGRLVVGLSVGGRSDDFEAAGTSFHRRGRRLDEMLAEMREVWSESSGIGPTPGRIPILLGGQADAVIQRVVAHADGWISAGGRPDLFALTAEKVRAAWKAQRRTGSPRLLAIGHFALGPRAQSVAEDHLLHYYEFLGDFAKVVAAGALIDASDLRRVATELSDAGCDELILFPCLSDPEQLTLLARALL